MIIILAGVAGSGKTTIGRLLAGQLGRQFIDGDDLHSSGSVDKMKRGIALTDSDRLPWLNAIATMISRLAAGGQSAIIACSALKKSYREILRGDNDNVLFVFLRGDFDLIEKRLRTRKEHFMQAGLLASQFADLEEPADALVVDISQAPTKIAEYIINKSGLRLKAEG